MTSKSPVYHRTSDGRKVVIVEFGEGFKEGKIRCYDVGFYAFEYYDESELTPWVEPETRTVWIQLWDGGINTISHEKRSELPHVTKLLGQVKRKITEGEFDE